jgi:Coenzyme PQQ synthesis protein D (PqqD)
MDKLPDAFRINREDVAAKVIDGEVIIIRLSDGTYYSMDNVGTHVWTLLETLGARPAVIETIAAWFGTPVGRVQDDVNGLIRELLAEGLIAEAAVPDGRAGMPEPPLELAAYESPRLSIHRDMGNLLALDPPTPGIDDLLLRTDTDESR